MQKVQPHLADQWSLQVTEKRHLHLRSWMQSLPGRPACGPHAAATSHRLHRAAQQGQHRQQEQKERRPADGQDFWEPTALEIPHKAR